MKVCRKCNEEKDYTEFSIDNSRKDGHKYVCKVCDRKENKVYRDNNWDTERDRSLNWVKNNKERITQLQIERKEILENNTKEEAAKILNQRKLDNWNNKKQNKDAYIENIEYQKKFREENYDYFIDYRLNNPDKSRNNAAKRRCKIINVIPKWADLDKIEEFYSEAVRLEQLDGIPRHVDHIIPIKHELVCGLHVENNLQILTADENRKKSTNFEPIIESFDNK